MPESPFTAAAYHALVECLQEKGWVHTPSPLERRVHFTRTGRHGIYRYSGSITHEGAYLQFHTAFTVLVSEEKLRPSVAELIVRANYSIQVGRFEIDMDDGEIGFRITHVIGESLIPREVLECYLNALTETVDRYFPAFMQHIHAGYTPEDAVFLSEIDLYAARIPDEPNPSPKANPKQEPPPQSPPADQTRLKAKKPRRKKSPGSQDELPL
jgi:hypothetical protein